MGEMMEKKRILAIFLCGLCLGAGIAFGIASHQIQDILKRHTVDKEDIAEVVETKAEIKELGYYEKVYNAILNYMIPVNDSDVVRLYFANGYLYVDHSEIVDRGSMPGHSLYRFGINGGDNQYFRNVLADEFVWDVSNWDTIDVWN